jgi:hypothetical protein
MKTIPPAIRRSAAGFALLAAACTTWAAGNVTGVTVTPGKGLSATDFKVTIQGTGQCSISLATGKDGPEGWTKTHTENLPLGGFPREWSFNPPALLGSKAVKGNLPTGKYTVWANTHATNSCNSNIEHVGSFEVATMQLPPPLPKCPEGWVLQSSSAGGAYTCKPKPPAPAQCPPKHEWFNDGCTAGCKQIIY